MQKRINSLKIFFDRLHTKKDRFLFIFIEKYWPRNITPNQLTVSRIFISIFLVFMISQSERFKTWILPVFLIGALTDLLDGAIARCLGSITRFGEIVDPIADRLLVLPIAFFVLMENNAWLLAAILATETINSLFSLYYFKRGVNVASNIFGKVKMTLQCIALLGMLLFLPTSSNDLFIFILWLSLPFMFLSIVSKFVELFNPNAFFAIESRNKN